MLGGEAIRPESVRCYQAAMIAVHVAIKQSFTGFFDDKVAFDKAG